MALRAAFAALLALWALACPAADWPMWRYDAGRTAASPEELPERMALQWVRELPTPQAAWSWDQYKLQFDASYEPIAAGNRVFVASMVRDSVTALDAATGAEVWRFHAEGPVRFAPVYADGRLYFASDDGCLYCLSADDGRLLFRFQPAPRIRRVLGNERMISTWPARGAPVLVDGVVYFAAGIWPFMGTLIYGLDAQTSEVVWENSGSGTLYLLQPHDSPAFANVAPQGYLAAVGETLLLPGGRSVPAAYERLTGAFRYYRGNTKEGDYAVGARDEWFVNGGSIHRLSDGEALASCPATVLAAGEMYGLGGEGVVVAQALRPPDEKTVTKQDKRGEDYEVTEYTFPELWRFDSRQPLTRVHLRAGSRLYAASATGLVVAVQLPAPGVEARVAWQARVEGEPWSMIAADGRLLVSTKGGRLYCFGAAGGGTSPAVLAEGQTATPPPDRWTEQASTILRASRVEGGYALVLGAGSGRLAEELARQSRLHVVVLEPDAARAAAARRTLDAAGLYGQRVAVLTGTLPEAGLPPYFAGLIASEGPSAVGLDSANVAQLFHCLRPYGGVACFPKEAAEALGLADAAPALPGAKVAASGGWQLLTREGPLPGAGSWTHQYADVGNTVMSPDRIVRAPLGLLWFGGPSNLEVLPRHGHGPSPQVVGGRLFIEGIGVFSARDVYTGRVLWSRKFEDLDTFGAYYDETHSADPFVRSYNQVHIPGANEVGANYVTTEDRVYLAAGPVCHVLDPATGEALADFRLNIPGTDAALHWGYLGVLGDLLIAGAAPIKAGEDEVTRNARFGAESAWLAVLDRYSGETLWTRRAVNAFRHNAIVAGAGRVFCLDGLTEAKLDLMRRRGMERSVPPRLLALDARTGAHCWSSSVLKLGTWLAYSTEHDVVLQGGSKSGDRAADEAECGMAAYHGSDGTLLWQTEASYLGPPILHHDRIIAQVSYGTRKATPAKAYSLLTGEEITRRHPLTGETVPWTWVRYYGCNTGVASENLLTFRSAAASFVDLASGQGTANLAGFRSGCTSNLIVADGVLSAPDYTRTCLCSYQNQSSLALVNDETAEMWSFDHFPAPSQPTPVLRLGLNLGAPGNRMAPDGTLFIEYPSVGGPSPDIPVHWEGDAPRWFRRHPAYYTGELPWVGASGLEGAGSLVIRPFLQPKETADDGAEAFLRHALSPNLALFEAPVGAFDDPRPYTVRLYFAEPERRPSGERVFTVALQGTPVLQRFSLHTAAGGTQHTVVHEFLHVPVQDDLVVTLQPDPASAAPPLLCGLDFIAEAP